MCQPICFLLLLLTSPLWGLGNNVLGDRFILAIQDEAMMQSEIEGHLIIKRLYRLTQKTSERVILEFSQKRWASDISEFVGDMTVYLEAKRMYPSTIEEDRVRTLRDQIMRLTQQEPLALKIFKKLDLSAEIEVFLKKILLAESYLQYKKSFGDKVYQKWLANLKLNSKIQDSSEKNIYKEIDPSYGFAQKSPAH